MGVYTRTRTGTHTGIIVAVRGDGDRGIYRDLSPGRCLCSFSLQWLRRCCLSGWLLAALPLPLPLPGLLWLPPPSLPPVPPCALVWGTGSHTCLPLDLPALRTKHASLDVTLSHLAGAGRGGSGAEQEREKVEVCEWRAGRASPRAFLHTGQAGSHKSKPASAAAGLCVPEQVTERL